MKRYPPSSSRCVLKAKEAPGGHLEVPACCLIWAGCMTWTEVFNLPELTFCHVRSKISHIYRYVMI